MMTKTCIKCGEAKSVDEFYRYSDRKTMSPHTECKVCYRARVQRWRDTQRTPEQVQRWEANRRERDARIKDAVFAAYGGYLCKCCNETERAFLTIDHVNNDGAAHRRAIFKKRTDAGIRMYRWLAKHGFPPGFQVLCMNCQFGKRVNGGTCPHQVRRNDHPLVGVEPSGSKRTAPTHLKVVG